MWTALDGVKQNVWRGTVKGKPAANPGLSLNGIKLTCEWCEFVELGVCNVTGRSLSTAVFRTNSSP